MSGIVRAVHQSSSKLGDTPLARLDLFESLPSRRFGCRASTTNSTTKSRSTSLYNGGASSRGGCRALQLYSAPERSTSLQLYSALHSTSSTPSLRWRPSRTLKRRQPAARPRILHTRRHNRDERAQCRALMQAACEGRLWPQQVHQTGVKACRRRAVVARAETAAEEPSAVAIQRLPGSPGGSPCPF